MTIICGCGCGLERSDKDIRDRPRRFISGHYAKSSESRHDSSVRFKTRVREKNPAWKGGRRIDNYGYIKVLVGRQHPKADKDGYVAEHIVVMEQHLCRSLTKQEVVHHINENRQDNRIENLAVMSRGDHKRIHIESLYGQKIKWKTLWDCRRNVRWLFGLREAGVRV